MKAKLVEMANDGAEVSQIVAAISELAGKPISPKVVRTKAYMRNVDFRPSERRMGGIQIDRPTGKYLVGHANARGSSPKALIGSVLAAIAAGDLLVAVLDDRESAA
jgi:hypothetical protein